MRSVIINKLEELFGIVLYIPDYRFFYTSFIVTAFIASNILAAKRGIPENKMVKANLFIFAFTYVCARLYNIFYHVALSNNIIFTELLKLKGTGSFGAYFGLILGSIVILRFMKINISVIHDIYAPLVALSLILGRLGCFMKGCCFGKVSHLPWAVSFPAGSPAYYNHLSNGLITLNNTYSLPVHPTQLYEAAFGIVMFASMIILYKKQRFQGKLLFIYFTCYCVFRFTIEFYRGDNSFFILSLSIAQLMAIFILLVSITGLILVSKKDVGPGENINLTAERSVK